MRWLRALLAATAMFTFAPSPVAAHRTPPAAVVFNILHFNDFHGQVEPLQVPAGQPSGGLARLAAQAGERREASLKAGEPSFLLFAGDLFTGTSFSSLFQGDPEFQALSHMRLTAMTTGNHEWDFGQGMLLARALKAGFPVVLANVATPDPERVFWRRALDLKAGDLKIGIVGVAAEDTPVTTAPGSTQGYTFTDPLDAVGAILRERGKGWDFVVVLSHCGFEIDKAMARRYPRIGLIVGGHDHDALEKPFVENGVPIVQAGDRGRFLGEVRVEVAKGRGAKVTGRLIPITASMPEDPAVKGLLAPWLSREELALGAVIGRLPAALSGDRTLLRTREAPIADLLADAMRAESKADIAFVNGGGIRAGLPEGDVTGRDLLACLPFFDSMATVRLTGAQVQALLDRCAAMPEKDPPGGFLQVSGLSARYRDGKASGILVGGVPIDPVKEYLVACSHFLLSGGDGLDEFKAGKDVRDWGVALQELMRRELANPDLVLPVSGGRIRRGD